MEQFPADVNKNDPHELKKQIAAGRYALLVIQLLTVVNLAMVLLDRGSCFLFTASVPYYLTLLARGLDNGFADAAWTVFGAYTYAALAVSVVILALYFLCWLLSREHPGWLAAAFVLFLLDSVAMLILTHLLYGSLLPMALDVFLHGWALWQLWQAVRANRKRKEQTGA